MATRRKRDTLAWFQPAILTGTLIPFCVIAYRWVDGRLGANPVATALNQLGLLALLLLLLTLACTPLRLLFGFTWAMRVRRTLGVMSFVAALSHFGVYLIVDRGLALQDIGDDLAKRPFIIVGFTALMLLVPLAATSTRRSVRSLGSKRWRALHRLAYVCASLGVVHFFMRVKADATEPLVYGALLVGLLGVRVIDTAKKRRNRQIA